MAMIANATKLFSLNCFKFAKGRIEHHIEKAYRETIEKARKQM